VFFYSLKICEEGRERLLDEKTQSGDSHPSPQERIDWIFEFAAQCEVSPQVLENMQYISSIGETLETYIQSRIELLTSENA
jgi:hypothetical protein